MMSRFCDWCVLELNGRYTLQGRLGPVQRGNLHREQQQNQWVTLVVKTNAYCVLL